MKKIIETLETLSKKNLNDVNYEELMGLCALLVDYDADSIHEGILPKFIEKKYIPLVDEAIGECYSDIFCS